MNALTNIFPAILSITTILSAIFVVGLLFCYSFFNSRPRVKIGYSMDIVENSRSYCTSAISWRASMDGGMGLVKRSNSKYIFSTLTTLTISVISRAVRAAQVVWNELFRFARNNVNKYLSICPSRMERILFVVPSYVQSTGYPYRGSEMANEDLYNERKKLVFFKKNSFSLPQVMTSDPQTVYYPSFLPAL